MCSPPVIKKRSKGRVESMYVCILLYLKDADLLGVLAVHRQQPVSQCHKVVDEQHALDAQLLGQLWVCAENLAVGILRTCPLRSKEKKRPYHIHKPTHLVTVDDPAPTIRHCHLVVPHGARHREARRGNRLGISVSGWGRYVHYWFLDR